MTTGQKIAKLRKEIGLTQIEFASKLNVSRQSVSKWESDVVFPEINKLIQISDILNCTIDYLLKYKEEDRGTVVNIIPEVTEENVTVEMVTIPAEEQKRFDVLRAVLVFLLLMFSIVVNTGPLNSMIFGVSYSDVLPMVTLTQTVLLMFSAMFVGFMNSKNLKFKIPVLTIFGIHGILTLVNIIISTSQTPVYNALTVVVVFSLPVFLVFLTQFKKNINERLLFTISTILLIITVTCLTFSFGIFGIGGGTLSIVLVISSIVLLSILIPATVFDFANEKKNASDQEIAKLIAGKRTLIRLLLMQVVLFVSWCLIVFVAFPLGMQSGYFHSFRSLYATEVVVIIGSSLLAFMFGYLYSVNHRKVWLILFWVIFGLIVLSLLFFAFANLFIGLSG